VKRIISALICISIMLSLPQTAHAHPGKTDSAGGHTDRSTGEYHYHHGYEAHNHYDMDGDGIVDCPYDFDDQTDHGSGSSENSSSSSYVYDQPYTKLTAQPIVITTESKKAEEVKPVPHWVYWVFVIMAAALFGLICAVRGKNAEIEAMQNRHYSELAELGKKHERELCAERDKTERNLSKKSAADKDLAEANDRLLKIKSEYRSVSELLKSARKDLEDAKKCRKMYIYAPPDVTFAEDGMPIYWKPDKNKPYGDYTVYISIRSNVYHTNPHCASYTSRQAHLFDVMDHMSPCKKCAINAFNFESVPNWFTRK